MGNSNSDKTFIATLAGLATGFLVGILIAPEKGSETRKRISKTSNDYLADIKDELGNLQKDLDQKIKEAQKGVEDLSEESKKKAEKVKDKAEENI